MDRFVTISGCSGGGKSTLLAELAQRGHAVVEEPGRRIVREELAGEGAALPWVDGVAFARRAVAMALRDRAMPARLKAGYSSTAVWSMPRLLWNILPASPPLRRSHAGMSSTEWSSSPHPGRRSLRPTRSGNTVSRRQSLNMTGFAPPMRRLAMSW